jgi:hypothetical protein
MLNQRTASKGFAGEVDGGPAPGVVQLPDVLVRWAERLQDQGLGEVGLVMTELMKVWGFAGSQILWMLTPFITHSTLASIATVLESPEMLDQLRMHFAGGLSPAESGRGGL